MTSTTPSVASTSISASASNWPWAPVLVWIDPLDSRERARARRALARKKQHQERLLAASQSRKSTPTPPHSRTSSPAPTPPPPTSRRNVVATACAAASPTTSTLTLASSMLQLAADAEDLSDVDMDDDDDDLSDVESSIPPPPPPAAHRINAPASSSSSPSSPPHAAPQHATASPAPSHKLALSLSSDDDDASDLDDAVTAALDSGDIELAKLFSPSEHPAIRRRLRDTQRLGSTSSNASTSAKSVAQAAHELVDAVGLSLEDEQLWWPAAVIPVSDIPGDSEITPQRKVKANELYVRYFEDNTFSIVLEADVQIFTGHDPLYHWFHERNPSELANNRGIRRALRFLNEGKVAHGFMWRKWRQRCLARSFPLVEDMSDTEERKEKAKRDKEREEARKVMNGELVIGPEGLSDLDDSDDDVHQMQVEHASPQPPQSQSTHHHYPHRLSSSSSVPTAPPSPSPFCDGEDPLQLDLELQMELDAIAALVDEDDASFVPGASTVSGATPRRAKGGSTGRPRGRPRGSGGGGARGAAALSTARKRAAPLDSGAAQSGGKRGPGRPPSKKKNQEQQSIPPPSSSSSNVPVSSSSLDRLSTSSPSNSAAIHSDDSLATPPLSASHSTSAHSTPPRLNSPDAAPAIVLPGPNDDLGSFQVSTVHAPSMRSSSLSLLDSSSPPPPDMHNAPALAAGMDASEDSRSTNGGIGSAKAAKGVSSRELAQLNKFFYCKDSTNLPPTRRRRAAARDGLISPTSVQFDASVMSPSPSSSANFTSSTLSSTSASSSGNGHGHGGARRASTSTVPHAHHQHQSRPRTVSGSSSSFTRPATKHNTTSATAHTPFSSLFHASLNFDLDDDADLSSVPPSPDVIGNPPKASARRVNGIAVKNEPGSKPRPAPLNLAGISAAASVAGSSAGQRTAPLMGTGFRDLDQKQPLPPASAGVVGLGLRRASSTGPIGASTPTYQHGGNTPARSRKVSVSRRAHAAGAGASPKAAPRAIGNGSSGTRHGHGRSRHKSPDARPHTPSRRTSITPPLLLHKNRSTPSPTKALHMAAAAVIATPLSSSLHRPSAAAKRYRTSLIARMQAHFSANPDHLADIDTCAPNVLPALVDLAHNTDEALDTATINPTLRTCAERVHDRLTCSEAVRAKVATGDELAWEAGLAELRRLQAEAVAVRKVAEALGGWDPNATVPNSPEGGGVTVEIGGDEQAGGVTKRSAAQAGLGVEEITVANRPKRARKLIDYSVFCVAGSPSPIPSPVPPAPAPIAVAAGVEQQHPLAQAHVVQQQRRPNAVMHPAAAGLASPPPPPMQPGSVPGSAMTSPNMMPMLPPSALFSTGISGATTMSPLPPPAILSHVGMRSPPLVSMYMPATTAQPTGMQSPVRMGYQPPLPPPTSSVVLPHYSPVFAPMHHPPGMYNSNHALSIPPLSSGTLSAPASASSMHFPSTTASSAPMSSYIPLPALPPPPPTPPATFLPPILTHVPIHHHHHHSAPSSSMPSPLMHHAALAAGGGGGASTNATSGGACSTSLLVVSPVSPPTPSASSATGTGAPPPPGVYAPAHVAAIAAHGMHAVAHATVTPQ
ncbi:hypothetical protein BCR44DRAFT_57701 [Catenaria anguillulae PL171]|uniref:PWWP domain-containing protein n=1 Tax=Catenaria anguillulae PL171 TaxID=765915 RepID=A0A1Y2H949_9FUNG|nr:hypothetical protein BCR44DRAFT_57701 [Catenaria anguillulae PL171]